MSLFNFVKKNRLGVDIGTASIKIVELSKESGRFKLENYCLFELESENNTVNAAEQLSDSRSQQWDQNIAWGIKEALKKSKISSKNVIVSIPSFSTFATVISMPYVSESEIAKAIPYEARKYIPIPISEVMMDWTIINVISGGTNQKTSLPTVEVFMVAVPKDEVERYRSIMKLAGLNLVALELENGALIRSLIGNDLSTVAIINIGGRSSSILIVDRGYERVSHNYEVGGFEITKSIARSLNVSLKRAEELKRNLGLKNVNSDMITEAMSSLIDLIVFEAKRIIHNYEEVKKRKINQILLIGGLTNMPMFVDYFGIKLGLPVTVGNALARVVYPPQLEPLKPELNSSFAIALGLAMRDAK